MDSVNDYEAHRGRSAWNHLPYTNAFGGWCMRALVTGGAGFIGSHLIDRLVARGDHVVVLDNLSSGNLDFIQGHLDSGDAVLVNGDLRSLDDVKQAMAMDIDCVYHLAANPDI